MDGHGYRGFWKYGGAGDGGIGPPDFKKTPEISAPKPAYQELLAVRYLCRLEEKYLNQCGSSYEVYVQLPMFQQNMGLTSPPISEASAGEIGIPMSFCGLDCFSFKS